VCSANEAVATSKDANIQDVLFLATFSILLLHYILALVHLHYTSVKTALRVAPGMNIYLLQIK